MIPLFKVHMPKSVMAPLWRTLASGYIGQGPRVAEFEHALVPWLGSGHVLTVNSGTSAIQLALRLAGVGPGDEVISTPMTCTATNVPIMAAGARIVWADIDPSTGNIDPDSVRARIGHRTKAIIAVDWAGYPCELDALMSLARAHGLKLIEDAAHAFGARYKGAPVGAQCDFVCFSFQAIKHLTTVDGGALVCRERSDHDRGKLLRWYGIDRDAPTSDLRCESDVAEWGYKFHMNDVSATIGLEQLKLVGRVLKQHRANAAYYRERFSGLRPLQLLKYQSDRESAYWMFTLRVRRRDAFQHDLNQAGVAASRVHVRNDLHTMFRAFRRDLPGVDAFSADQVSIPVGWWLTRRQRDHIVETVTQWCR